MNIVGAGPVGLYLAQQLNGIGVEVFEEHSSIGDPAQCTGLFSTNIDSLFKIPQECILNKVKGARFYSPSGNVVELSRKSDQAYVVDRTKFDQALAEGVDTRLGTKITSIESSADYIIGADGPSSTVARLAGFPPLEDVLVGVQYEIPADGHEQDFVEMHFGNEVAPGFFMWVVPTGDRLRIGLANDTDPVARIEKFIKSKFGNPKILEKTAGAIPLKWRESVVKGNVALVGDAAGQVKPTTGGGIYMGFLSAKILANAIKQDDLSLYKTTWDEQVLPELSLGYKFRTVLKKLSDSELDNVFEILGSEKIRKLIEEHGDMDRPSLLLKGFLGNPASLKLLPYLRYLWG